HDSKNFVKAGFVAGRKRHHVNRAKFTRSRSTWVLVNVRSLSGAPRQELFERAPLRGGGALSIGPFEVTRSRGERGSYGKCFWFWYSWRAISRGLGAIWQVRSVP